MNGENGENETLETTMNGTTINNNPLATILMKIKLMIINQMLPAKNEKSLLLMNQ